MARHKHADLMIRAAENWDGLEWRWRFSGDTRWKEWRPFQEKAPAWVRDFDYEIRPIRRPLFQKRVEVPRGEINKPSRHANFYVPDPRAADFYSINIWDDTAYQQETFYRGLVYLNPDDAAARGRAMVEVEE